MSKSTSSLLPSASLASASAAPPPSFPPGLSSRAFSSVPASLSPAPSASLDPPWLGPSRGVSGSGSNSSFSFMRLSSSNCVYTSKMLRSRLSAKFGCFRVKRAMPTSLSACTSVPRNGSRGHAAAGPASDAAAASAPPTRAADCAHWFALAFAAVFPGIFPCLSASRHARKALAESARSSTGVFDSGSTRRASEL